MFGPIDKWTLTLKVMERETFLMEPNHQCHLFHWGEWVDGAQSQNKKRLLFEYMFVPTARWTLTLKMMEREAILMKPKHQSHLSQWGEWVYGAQSWKEKYYYVKPCLP